MAASATPLSLLHLRSTYIVRVPHSTRSGIPGRLIHDLPQYSTSSPTCDCTFQGFGSSSSNASHKRCDWYPDTIRPHGRGPGGWGVGSKLDLPTPVPMPSRGLLREQRNPDVARGAACLLSSRVQTHIWQALCRRLGLETTSACVKHATSASGRRLLLYHLSTHPQTVCKGGGARTAVSLHVRGRR